ncbi:MAG: SDR family oxidoreductase [Acidobacteria bacterium]|nr:SDR family oxidoreductase [Acidobacteriota bacterium]
MDRVCFVTGGTRGIGRAVVTALLSGGDRVAFTGTSSARVAEAERALAAAYGDPARIVGMTCDVRDPGAVAAAIGTVVSRFGGLDVLVNNAGVGVGTEVANLSHDDWRHIIETNLTGVFNCCHAAIPHFKSRGAGWIISVSSLASKNAFAGGAAYCASKAGLNAFSEALMQEVRHDNIRVSYVLPGSVATEFSGRPEGTGADWKLLPQDVADVIVDLLAHPARSLPSRVEIRPSRPKKA